MSNTIPYETIRTCELTTSIENSKLCVKLQEGVFEKQSSQSFTSSIYFTLSYDTARSTSTNRDVWSYSDSDVNIEIGGKINNSWYIIVKDLTLEGNVMHQLYGTMLYLSKEDPSANYPWCATWDWDTGFNDDTIGDAHNFEGDSRYEQVLAKLNELTLQGIRRLVNEVNQGTCSDVYDMSVFNFKEESISYELQNTEDVAHQDVKTSDVRSDYLGPSFRHVLMTCNIRDGIVAKESHSTMMYKVDYRDYLIMKEWLRLGNPDPKNLQSENSLIDWFNANSRDGTPFACALPHQIYDWVGTGFAFANAYFGEENL